MIIKTNIPEVISDLAQKLAKATDNDYLLKPLCVELIPQIHERIHIRGQATDGQNIGTYSDGYMAVRTGKFKSAELISRGKNKGKVKNAGTISQGDKKGGARPNYHRSGDTKVIISLTRQLENDYAVIATEKGYGIGFNNQHNFDKAGWVEEIYSKHIFDLTIDEEKYAEDRINELVSEALK